MYCNYHGGREAVTKCEICGKPICKACKNTLGDICMSCYEEENNSMYKRFGKKYGIMLAVFLVSLYFFLSSSFQTEDNLSIGIKFFGIIFSVIVSIHISTFPFAWKKVKLIKVAWLTSLGYVGLCILFCIKFWGLALLGWYYAIKEIRADIQEYRFLKNNADNVQTLKMMPKYQEM